MSAPLVARNDYNSGLPNVATLKTSGWVFSADYLYWFPSEEVNSIWASIISVGFDTSTWGLPGFNFTWSPGFRIGTGYDFSYDQWSSNLTWTWFRTQQSHTLVAPANTIISPEFDAAFLSFDNAQKLKGNWTLLFNMWDWNLSRSYRVSKSLSLEPFLGIKAGTIRQAIRAHYYDLTIDTVLTTNQGKERLKNNFWGIGPMGGINTKWQIRKFGCHHFHLFGDFSMATLWGSWTCRDHFHSTASQTFTIKTKNSSLGAPMFRGFLGLGWDLKLPTSQLATKVGFETQVWMNQLRIATLQVQRLHGDLTLQGLTFNCRYDY
jgi:hypothetical protein